MDYDRSWALVETTRPADGDCDRHAAALTIELCKLPPEEIVAFDGLRYQLYVDAGTKDLFAAACLINASGSDDNFWYFLGWLLSQGRALFEVAIRDPESLADHFRRQGITAATCGDDDRWAYWCQEIEYAADHAYEAVTGLESPLPDDDKEEEAAAPPHPSPWYIDRLDGPPLDLGGAEQLRQRLPRLWALFGPEATG